MAPTLGASGSAPRTGAGGAAGAGVSTATVPRLGPEMLPPPYANGTPRCESARAITTLIACWWVESAVAKPGVATNIARLIATAKMRFMELPIFGRAGPRTP